MKTSDKLLLALITLGLVIFTGIQLTLYAKFKQGDILTSKELLEQRFSKYQLPSRFPAFISVKGFQEVNIYPSDSFYFELEKKYQQEPSYYFQRDTAYLNGNEREIQSSLLGSGTDPKAWPGQITDPNKQEIKVEIGIAPKLSQQHLNLYCPSNSKIRLEDGEIFLHGSIHSDDFNAEIYLINSHFELGNYYSSDHTFSNRFYHNISIHSIKSGMDLNVKSVIHKLDISMDDGSNVNDNDESPDSLGIECTNQSRLQLSGRNIRKLKVNNNF